MHTIFQVKPAASESRKVSELELSKKKLETQLQEMTRTVQKQQELLAQAKRDTLTGLMGRQGISEQIDALLHSDCRGTFFIMDMDNFKNVNDTYGHMEGDQVLVRFAKGLKKAVAANDITARLGGDEFIVFSPGHYDKYELQAKAQRILRQIERELITPGRLVRVTVWMGIASAPFDGGDYEALYGNSDKALYYVKHEGKNGYQFFSEICEIQKGSAETLRQHRSLGEITKSLKERKMEGSYEVAYNDFEKIYRFMERNLMREYREVQCVLFTLEDGDGTDERVLEEQLAQLQHAVASSLRKGDVTAKYSTSQVLALLMDVNRHNADAVVNRLLGKYRREAGKKEMRVIYDIEQLLASEEVG